jgi:predicted Holliday junction resolvase-like endonuclease
MKGINKKTVWQTAVFIFFIVVVGMIMYSQQKEISLLRRKTELNAKEIEALKIDLNTKKESGAHGNDELPRKDTDFLFLHRKMTEMKKEVEKFKKATTCRLLMNTGKKKRNCGMIVLRIQKLNGVRI